MRNKHKLFENLVNAYSGWLYRYAFWLCGNRAEAEDLVQETFTRAWRFLDSLESESAAKSWLTTIVRRENARKYDRKQFDYVDVELEDVPSERESADIRPEILSLRRALMKLPLQYREPLILQVMQGYSLEEIASHFDIPRNTAATRLHRARQKLKTLLDGKERDELSGI